MAKYNFNSDSEAKSYMESITNSPEFKQLCKTLLKPIKHDNHTSKSSSKQPSIFDLSLSKGLLHDIIFVVS